MSIKKISHKTSIISWLIGLTIVVYFISTIDVNILLTAFIEAKLIEYSIIAGIFVFFWFLFESHNLYLFIKYYGYNARYDQILILRASTYLLTLINYHLGTGGIIVGLNIRHGIPLKESTGLTLLYATADNLCLSILTFLATIMAVNYIPKNILIPLMVISFAVIVIIISIFAGFRALHIFKIRRFVNFYKIISEELLKISTFDYIKIIILRSIYFLTFSIFIYLSVPLFGFKIPLIAVLAMLPSIFLISNLPITPAGVGTTQAAMLLFFSPFGATHKILLFSLIYTTSLIAYRLIIGLISLFFLDNKKIYFLPPTRLDNSK